MHVCLETICEACGLSSVAATSHSRDYLHNTLKIFAECLSKKNTTFIYPSFIRSFDVPGAIRENISDHDILPLAECHDILFLGLAGAAAR